MIRCMAIIAVVFSASCATPERAAFDPEADPRIGEEVAQACVRTRSGFGGGYRNLQGRDAFVFGDRGDRYVMVFSRGCAELGPAGAFPIFENRGDSCRRRGEFVRTARGGGSVGGGCTVEQIFRWDENAADEESEE